jgi:FkbM family methyltransferase
MSRRLSEIELEQTKTIEGWIWPYKDVKCWPWLQREKDLPDLISKHCKDKNVVVEAGGNAGFYVKAYANLFKTVYTFEPDNLNFRCLTANVEEKNVFKFQACLGYDRQLVNLNTSRGNIGSYHVEVDTQENISKGIIPTLRIDDLNLPQCDLIHLDIEGFELEALKGSIETITRTRPVIAVEWMNHGSKYEADDNQIQTFLEQLGYSSIEKIYHENIFVYQK